MATLEDGTDVRRAPKRSFTRMPAEERQEVVIMAFVEEAIARGSVQSVGVRAVGERAGCSAANIFRIYGTRDDLVRAVVKWAHELLLEETERLANDANATATMKLRMLASLQLRKERRRGDDLVVILMGEATQDSMIRGEIQRTLSRFEDLLVSTLRDGIEAGEFRADIDVVRVAWEMIEIGLFALHVRMLDLGTPMDMNLPLHHFESVMARIAAAPAGAGPGSEPSGS